MLRKCERYITEIIRGKRQGTISSVLKGILRLFSWPYKIVVACRNWAYDKEWFRQYQAPVPIMISVGNIVAGGTGKTPVTLMLAKAFYEEYSIGILSRGYRAPVEKLSSPIALSVGKGPFHSAAYCGDEPYLLSQNLPEACVYVGKNRHKSANMAAMAGNEIVILDDGMQHRSIGRDFEVVVVDIDDPFGQGYYLPRGLLRENPRSLSRADFVIINNIDDPEQFERTKHLIQKHTTASVVGTRFEISELYDLQGNEINTLHDKRVALFSGIAQPERFEETVQRAGAHLLGHEIFSDHHQYYGDQINKLVEKYKAMGAEMLVCTEKDKVKLPDIPELFLPIVWPKMQLKVVVGESDWEGFLQKIREDLAKRTQKTTSCGIMRGNTMSNLR